MAKKLRKNNKEYFQCETCKFAYKEKETAEKCQDWCNKYKSCNVEITKHAVQL